MTLDVNRRLPAAQQLLLEAIRSDKPLVLLLGAHAWTGADGSDAVLAATLRRLEAAEAGVPGWSTLLRGRSLTDDDMQWIAERFSRLVPPESLQDTLDLPWSAVFSTSIDPRLLKRLETHGRQPEPVLSTNHFSRVPRSRSRPPLYYLLGRAGEGAPDARPPRSRTELARRLQNHTTPLLNRIPETVTPRGVLVVVGYEPASDWLPLDAALASLGDGPAFRVVWFEPPPAEDSELLQELAATRRLVSTPHPFAEALAELRAEGALSSTISPMPDEPGIITVGVDKFIDVPASLRLRVEASAAIVDDTWTAPTTDAGTEADAFARFHGDHGGARQHVEGIARGFAIERKFEADLLTRVKAHLRQPSDRVIILHGQSGTGKTVAIARLALTLRREHLPVVLASDRVPQPADVDDFCSLVERAEVPFTVILCDANQPATRYRDLANSLRSKGRRVVVVGTSYRLENPRSGGLFSFVEAPTDVPDEERTGLLKLVQRVGGVDLSRSVEAVEDNNVLAFLYRFLAAARGRLTAGINSEVRAVEEEIRHRGTTHSVRALARTTLADALIRAGVVDTEGPLLSTDPEHAALGTDAAARLIDYVMAAGRLNSGVPVNLLLRVIHAKHEAVSTEDISTLFRDDLDIFRWHFADAEGNELVVSPRLQLEAELICRRRLADPNRELDCIIDLIEGIRAGGVDHRGELEFLLDLLQKLDHDGPRGGVYRDGYLRVSQALTTLRVRHHVLDTRLMLQESAFRRACLRVLDRVGDIPKAETDRDRILNECREVVEFALGAIAERTLDAGRRTRENLHVERASIYGFLAVGRARSNGATDAVWSDYVAARTAVSRAMAVADSYFPFDIGLWTPVDILTEDHNELPSQHQAEMRADIYAILDQVDTARLPPAQQQKFQRRRGRIARALGDGALEQDAYQELEKIAPPVAYFLRAREFCPEVLGRGKAEEPFAAAVRERAAEGAAFLASRDRAISSDVRCLHLWLQFQWAALTGYRLMRGERRPLPSGAAELSQALRSVSKLNTVAGAASRFVFRYLEGTLAWMSRDVQHARNVWRLLGQETEYEDPSRVVRRLYIAHPDGKPVLLDGRVDKQRNEGHWNVKVDGLPGDVDLLKRDFPQEDIGPGRYIRGFAVAFNYLGPIADSAARYGALGAPRV